MNLIIAFVSIFFFFIFLRFVLAIAFMLGIRRGMYMVLKRMGRSDEAAIEYIAEFIIDPKLKPSK